jgi:Subtilase family
VLDTGVSLSHPDLQGKIVASTNFSSSSTVDDVKGHGSHVAGIAAAATNNAVGVAGVGYSVDINVKVLGDSGSGLYSDMCSGITWAADHGADVINLSLGGTMASSALESAVNYAWSKGVVVVAAAGNSASSSPFYPAYYANVMAVAATTDLGPGRPDAPGVDRHLDQQPLGLRLPVAALRLACSGCGSVAGATAAGYTLGSADVGSTMGVLVTATNVGGSASAQSAQTALIAAVPPANTSPPTESGSAKPGQTLTSSAGAWTGTAPLDFAYQWLRCDSTGAGCAEIGGACASSYTVSSADLGSTIGSRVTASNAGGQASAESAPTVTVTNVQTHTFTGAISKSTPSVSFPVTTGAGQVDAGLAFAKSATMSVKLVDANGKVLGQASGKASPVELMVAGLAAGVYRYMVGATGYKGSVSVTLTVTAPAM